MITPTSQAGQLLTYLQSGKAISRLAEAKQKAELWQVADGAFKFNGTRFPVWSNADIEDVIAEWESARENPYGICAG